MFLVAPSTTYYSGDTFYVDGYVLVVGFSTIESMEMVIAARLLFGDRNTWIIPDIWTQEVCKSAMLTSNISFKSTFPIE